MSPVIDVLLYSDVFSHVWEGVVTSAGAVMRSWPGGEVAGGVPGDSAGVILAVGGMEDAAPEALAELSGVHAPRVAVVGLEAEHRRAVAVLKAGADEFFLLPADLGALRAWVQDRADVAAGAMRVRALAKEQRNDFDFSRIIGQSPGLRAALDRAARVIPRGSATVLLTGETGTGKDVLARAIHYNGPRSSAPFIEINCAALPPNLLEAELFGYERGAFTDAKAAKPGLFEAANGGTLFLDEIGDLSIELQGKLLRVLETKRVRRLGSVNDRAVDVRIIAATHVDLTEASRTGDFRSDLYYRLSVVPIHLPPLRERGHDIILLAEHFLSELCREYETPPIALTPEIARVLLAHSWPGNVRELKNSLERAVVLGGAEIDEADLFVNTPARPTPSTPAPIPFPATLAEIDAAVARETLRVCGGNKSEAARVLGISRRHLYVLIERGGEHAQ